MADRTSAEIFGTVFQFASKLEQTDEVKKFIKTMWSAKEDYDFNEYQMDVDEALLKLGLAKQVYDPEFLENGPGIEYAEPNGKFR